MIGNIAAMNINVQIFVLSLCFQFFGYIPRSGNDGLYGNSMCKFLRNHQSYCFPKLLHHFTFSPTGPRFPISPLPCQQLLFTIIIF